MDIDQREKQEEAKKAHVMAVKRKRRRMALALNRFIHSTDGAEVWEHITELFKLNGKAATAINLGTHYGYDTNTIMLTEGGRQVVIYLNDLAAEGTSGDGNIEEQPEKKVIMP